MPKHKPTSEAAELSPAAIAILEAAADREDGALRPLAVRMPPTAERALLARLREAGLIETVELELGPHERIAERGRTRMAMRAMRAALEGQPNAAVASPRANEGSHGAPEALVDGEVGDAQAGPAAGASGHDCGANAPRASGEDEAFEPPAFLRRDAECEPAGGAGHAGEHAVDVVADGQQARPQRRRGPGRARPPAEAPANGTRRAAGHPVRQAGEGAPARRTKGARLLELLRRPSGASIDEITGELGWLAHTARARIAVDVRGRGHPVVTERVERGGRRLTVYRVGPADPA